MEINDAFETLRQKFESFPLNSPELEAAELIFKLQHFVSFLENRNAFEKYVKNRSLPLSGLDVIKMRCYGIDIPKELQSEKILKLSVEIDDLANKINSTIAGSQNSDSD